jgi:hypothetical protein
MSITTLNLMLSVLNAVNWSPWCEPGLPSQYIRWLGQHNKKWKYKFGWTVWS